MLTYKEIAHKYKLSESDISIAVRASGIKYKGYKNVNYRSVRTWDEAEVIGAVAKQLAIREERYRQQATRLAIERCRLLEAVKQDGCR